MTADQHAEINIEINELSAAIWPVLDRVTCAVWYVLATGGSLGGSQEEMEEMRAAIDPVLAQNPNLRVSAKVASNHSHILRKDFRAIAEYARPRPPTIGRSAKPMRNGVDHRSGGRVRWRHGQTVRRYHRLGLIDEPERDQLGLSVVQMEPPQPRSGEEERP
jgi:hypothetical protein